MQRGNALGGAPFLTGNLAKQNYSGRSVSSVERDAQSLRFFNEDRALGVTM
jgi:hypothetical protein